MPFENPVKLIDGEYNYEEFLDIAKGLEHEPEGGARCFACYRLRLEKTAA
jgi:predicted adenine nucleotide alpha hydrolase (AANH) superfamily ATPase